MPFLGTTGGGSVKQYGGQANLGYFIKNSLRFRASASANLSKTYGTSPTSRTTITHSFWLKIGALSNAYNIFALFGTFNNYEQISLVSPNNTNGWIGNSLRIAGPGGSEHIRTTQLFRDPAAWYHIVVVYDTTNATATDRVRLYVNGSRVTAFAASANPTQNQQTTEWLVSSFTSNIGITGNSSTQTFDGYMAEINVIDGQALTPSSFGKTDAVTGQWVPKKFASTYGTNGFYLKFADASAATAAAIGKDSSPNGNNWTPNNISVTAGATYDAMIDSPTLSAVASNYCVMNPLDNSSATLTNGNLQVTSSGASWKTVRSTFAMPTGSWYCELTATVGTGNGNSMFGIIPMNVALPLPVGEGSATSWSYSSNGNVYNNGSIISATGVTWSAGTTVAMTFDGSTLKFYNAGNLVATINSIPANTYAIGTSFYDNNAGAINFGQRPFAYTPPSGFKSLNTFNLP